MRSLPSVPPPIAELTAPDVLAMLRAIEKRGTVDMAHRVQQHCGAVFRFAVSSGKGYCGPYPKPEGGAVDRQAGALCRTMPP